MPIKQSNTKLHWTALAVARFYEKHGTACRARDLYPYVEELHDTPDHLISALYDLNDTDTVDHSVVMSPRKTGGDSKTFAYYPTPITTETLRDLGEPTELPDGSPVPDDIDTSIPTDRVAAEDEVPPPENQDTFGLEYDTMGGTRPKEATRNYDTSRRAEEPQTSIVPDSTDEPGSDTDEVPIADEVDPCPYCGRDDFEDSRQKGGHMAHCGPDDEDDEIPGPEGPEPELETFDDADNVDTDAIAPKPGMLAKAVDWNQVASDLEERAQRASEAGFDDIASAYSQFAALAVEESLDRETAFILLGTPVLDMKDDAALMGTN